MRQGYSKVISAVHEYTRKKREFKGRINKKSAFFRIIRGFVVDHRDWVVMPGQVSERKGQAGSPFVPARLQTGLEAQQ
jgi:hypothetical protein